jgi:hypothetical protein
LNCQDTNLQEDIYSAIGDRVHTIPHERSASRENMTNTDKKLAGVGGGITVPVDDSGGAFPV